MAYPSPYVVSYSFGGFQASNPTTPLPGPALDNELAGVAAAVAELVAGLEDVRRSDGTLNNGIVTYDSLSSALQLTFDPTNGALVAAAVAGAQASATAAAASNTSAANHDTSAGISAAAAAASAGTVNLSLYLAKANNLAGLGSTATARSNLGVAKADGSDITGRLAPTAGVVYVTDWNAAVSSGWYAGNAAANAPDAGYWLVQVIAYDEFNILQTAYNFTGANTSNAAIMPMRRCSYNVAGITTWRDWESFAPVQIGSTIWVNATSAPPGYLKENGALLSRTSFPALYTFAAASGNIVSEATWSGGSTGAFSTGDLATTFRLPDARGEFIRGYDDSRGIDSGRVIGAHQVDLFKSHQHTAFHVASSNAGGVADVTVSSGGRAIDDVTGLTGGTETRPRNNAKLACIKY